MFAASPSEQHLLGAEPAREPAPSSEVAMAVSTCGRNMAPYWVLLRSYSVGSVRIVLAAGKVTRVMPWTSPARLTTRYSAVDAIVALAFVRPVSRAGRAGGRRRAGRWPSR